MLRAYLCQLYLTAAAQEDDYQSHRPFFGSPLCKTNTAPPTAELKARSVSVRDLAPLALAFPAQVAHTNATVCFSQLKSCYNNHLHGCMITVLCMVDLRCCRKHYVVDCEVCWLVWTWQRGIGSQSYLLSIQVGLWVVAVAAYMYVLVCACKCACVSA